jgi:hypothetical protein
MGTWPNGQPLEPYSPPADPLPPYVPPDPPRNSHAECDEDCERRAGKLQETLAHLMEFNGWDAESQAGHLRTGHGVAVRWAEQDDPVVLRSYHHNAHDREMQAQRQ